MARFAGSRGRGGVPLRRRVRAGGWDIAEVGPQRDRAGEEATYTRKWIYTPHRADRYPLQAQESPGSSFFALPFRWVRTPANLRLARLWRGLCFLNLPTGPGQRPTRKADRGFYQGRGQSGAPRRWARPVRASTAEPSAAVLAER